MTLEQIDVIVENFFRRGQGQYGVHGPIRNDLEIKFMSQEKMEQHFGEGAEITIQVYC